MSRRGGDPSGRSTDEFKVFRHDEGRQSAVNFFSGEEIEIRNSLIG